jgi:predicted DCC family thiol-disulfide oxidoreductase YuxK
MSDTLTVLYDGTCGFCTRQARFARRLAGPHRTQLLSTAEPGVRERYGVSTSAADRQMHVIDAAGRRYGGAAAVARLVRAVPFAGAIGWLYYLPGLRQLADATYRWVSRNRYAISRRLGWDTTCDSGTCTVPLDSATPTVTQHRI